MKTKWWMVSALLVTLFSFMAPAWGHGHGHDRPVKKGILLVAFGTSIPEARAAFDHIDASVKAAFEGVPVRWAFTSRIIRQKLAGRGEVLESPAVALARMMDEGFTHVAVQSLHTIRGEEYQDLVHTAHAFQGMPEGFDRIVVGEPLLSGQRDMERVVAAILANIPAGREQADAVVLMGHGTPHPANAFYAALMFHLQARDPHLFVGTVEGAPAIDDILAMLQARHIRKAFLIPFMSVAGDHARNDMAGPEADSWKSVLTSAGIQAETVLKGTAEYDNMVAIWVDHLRTAMAHFPD